MPQSELIRVLIEGIVPAAPGSFATTMSTRSLRRLLTGFLLLLLPTVVAAQSGEPPTGQQPPAKGNATEKEKEPKKANEFEEAAKKLGGPAAHAECVWLGRRVVNLLTRDDLDTAYRHLELYDRFGCPGEHIRISFRCVVRQGHIDLKAAESLNARVHQCWINPALQPAPAAASTPAQQPATQQ